MLKNSLTICAAGSLRQYFADLKKSWQKEKTEVPLEYVFGPAGLLYDQVIDQKHCDLFCSANLKWTNLLFENGRAELPIAFASTELCATVLKDSPITDQNIFNYLTHNDCIIGMSTPKSDPSGDYTLLLIEKIKSINPLAAEVLLRNAIFLVGNTLDPAIALNNQITMKQALYDQKVDLMIGYFSSAKQRCEDDQNLRIVKLPPFIAVKATYYYVLCKGCQKTAQIFAAFLRSYNSVEKLEKYGFKSVYRETNFG